MTFGDTWTTLHMPLTTSTICHCRSSRPLNDWPTAWKAPTALDSPLAWASMCTHTRLRPMRHPTRIVSGPPSRARCRAVFDTLTVIRSVFAAGSVASFQMRCRSRTAHERLTALLHGSLVHPAQPHGPCRPWSCSCSLRFVLTLHGTTKAYRHAQSRHAVRHRP